MPSYGDLRLPGSRTLHPALVQLCALAVVLGSVQAVLLVGSPEGPFVLTILLPLTGWVHIGAGVVAWTRRPHNRIGRLLCADGVVWLVAGLVNTPVPLLAVIGNAVALLPVAVVVHALLAFPSGRLHGPWTRAVVAVGYAVTILLQVPGWLFADPTAVGPNPLQIADRPDLASLGREASSIGFGLLIIVTGILLGRRLRSAGPRARHVLSALYGYGGLALIAVSFAANLRRVAEVDPIAIAVFQIVLLAGVPFAFIAALLLGGFARTAEIEELGAWLGTAERGRGDLGAAVARTLGDPSLTLVFRSADQGWVDGLGRPVDLPPDRRSVRVWVGDRTVGAIVYDPTLLPDVDVVRTAGRVVAIAVDRERLTAQLLAGQEQLRVSRTRLVEAGDRERRRLAQDLHDRLQGRLVLLALLIGRLQGGADVEQIRRDLDEVISELRLVVQGVMPALLIERGLAAAVEEMTERLPLRAILDLAGDDEDGARLPEPVEGTAYHVVAEAITNAVKHAGASELRIAMRRRDGVLHVEVHDDGVGGARSQGGAGLRGIGDRVDALGGRLAVHSPPGGGTLLAVELPCGR